MAKVKVFCWRESGMNVGHSSMLLIKDELYISFWPAEALESKQVRKSVIGLGNVRSTLQESYEEDCDAEGREADDIVIVSHLDKYEIKKFWNSVRGEDYNLKKRNCSTIVMVCLYVGSGRIVPKQMEKSGVIGKTGDFFGACTPELTHQYAKQLERELLWKRN